MRAPLMQYWIAVALPNGGSGTAPPGVEGKFNTLFTWLVWGALTACVAGLIFALVKMAVAKRHNEEFNGGGIIMSMIAAIGIVSATGLITGII